VVVAETQAEAERLVRPHLLGMVALRTGGELRSQLTVEEAERTELGSHTALAEITALARRYGVDEVMVHPVAGSSSRDALDRAPAREVTLELLAAARARHKPKGWVS